MDHLIGQRFNLISKSEIRYVGTLHEINPEQSTIALEDVYSFGTEGRKADSFIPASQQKFDYIVFRGSDVKDIKIAEEQSEVKKPSPPNMPNDPAILNSSRPGQTPGQSGPPPPHRDQSPFHPSGYPPQPQFGGFYPPQQFGRGFGPPPGQFGPGPGFHGMPPYGPPPPGYYGPPPGQGFPQGPPNQFSPPPIGPPGQRQPGPPNEQQQQPQLPKPTSELPVDNKASEKAANKSTTPAPPANVPTPPVESRPPISEALKPASTAAVAAPPTMATIAARPAPSNPKNNRVTPAVPMTVNQKSFVPPVAATANGPLSSSTGNAPQAPAKQMPSQTAMEEASRQAKEAVAAAMAKLNPQAAAAAKAGPSNNAMDALTRKVGEMRTTEGAVRGRGGPRGQRGGFRSGSGGQPPKKMEIPKDDYDFESANARFNKDDLVKEANASGSPVVEKMEGAANGIEEAESSANGEKRKDSLPVANTQGYNKSSSFFDNISSEAKDRQEAQEDRAAGRAMRGEEFKKNVETFGQGNVDTNYRGRGRGRGYRGHYGQVYRGGYNRGYGGRGGERGAFNNNGFRGRGRGGTEAAT